MGATPASCAASPTAIAISTATRRKSSTGGSSRPLNPETAGECSASERAAAKIIPSVTRRALEAITPRPIAGKIQTLLHCAIGTISSPYFTGANGDPVATSARPLVHAIKSAADASDFDVGFDSGKIIGRATLQAI